jgi:hypothetical protein
MKHNFRFFLTPLILIAVLTAIGFTLIPGCACRSAEKKNTPGCVFVNNFVDCTTAEIKSFIPKVLPLVQFLLAGANGDPNWQNYLVGLESMGLGALACTAEIAMDNLVSEAALLSDAPDLPGGMMSAGRIQSATKKAAAANTAKNWQKWKADRVGLNVKFKTK